MAQIAPTMQPNRYIRRRAHLPQDRRSRLSRIAHGSADLGRVLFLGILSPQNLVAEERSWPATLTARDS